MAKRKSAKPGNMRAEASMEVKAEAARAPSLLPAGSPQRAAADIAAAAGGALLTAATFGVGATALAWAAGYLAYRETIGSQNTGEAVQTKILKR